MREILRSKYRISLEMLLKEDPDKFIEHGVLFEVSHIQGEYVFLIPLGYKMPKGKESKIMLPISSIRFAFEIIPITEQSKKHAKGK